MNYKPKRSKNFYIPNSKEPFKLSRTKVELFMKCPRCFYIDRRLGVSPPPGFPFNLNSAVDNLLKNEFDQHRAVGTPHPLMVESGIDAIPFAHDSLDTWRNSLSGGVQFHHKKTNFILHGGVDDVWVNSKGELIVVDYKATAKKDEVSLDSDWQDGYKRQVEFYQWLFRHNEFEVSDVAYFVYCNGNANEAHFDKKLTFRVSIIPYKGSDSWIPRVVSEIFELLNSSERPRYTEDCDFCNYIKAMEQLEKG